MNKTTIEQVYYHWLLQKIYDPDVYNMDKYNYLLDRLSELTFFWTNPMDVSRIDDAIDLRYRFGREEGFPEAEVARFLDAKDPSVLEVMVALAVRAEEHILGDNAYGDRCAEWFWVMITSMHLDYYDDRHYTHTVVDAIVLSMLRHRYSRNGDGGLFTVNVDENTDMRKEDIWYQMMRWINQNITL